MAPRSCGQQREPPVGPEHGAGRELMRGREEHGVGVGCGERVDVHPVPVDGNRHGLEPGPADRLRLGGPAWILDGDTPGAAGAHRLAQQSHRLHGPARREHRVGGHVRAPRAIEVARQLAAEPRDATGIAIVQRRVGRLAQRGLDRCSPRAARERREIGRPVPKVEPGSRVGRLGAERARDVAGRAVGVRMRVTTGRDRQRPQVEARRRRRCDLAA